MVPTATIVRLAALATWLLALPVFAGDLPGAFARVVARAGIDAYTVELRLTADPSHTSAMSARYLPGTCTIVALDGATYLEDALDGLDLADHPVFLEAMLAHEIAHCEERHLGSARPGDPGLSRPPSLAGVAAALTADGRVLLKPVDRLELWGEILADAYMFHYLLRWHPARADAIAAAQFERRSRDAAIDPAHATATVLRDADFTGISGETLLQAALRTRATAPAQPRTSR